jgi:hypothetical protein
VPTETRLAATLQVADVILEGLAVDEDIIKEDQGTSSEQWS